MTSVPSWQRILMAISVMQVAIGFAISVQLALTGTPRVTPTLVLLLAHVAVYAAAAWVLIAGGTRDHRAVLLGTAFLLTASSFTPAILRLGATSAGLWRIPALLLVPLAVDAFTPYFLWRFVGQFPRGPDFGVRYHVVQIAARVSLIVGAGLLALNVVRAFAGVVQLPAATVDLIGLFTRNARGSAYWPIVYGLALPAFAHLWIVRGSSSRDERRRVALLGLGLLICAGPTVAYVFASEMWPAVRSAIPVSRAGFVLYPLLLILPVWTTYVVRVHHALDVRLVARRAVQYALARQTAVLLAFVPFVLLAVELYGQRGLSVQVLLSSRAGFWLGVLVVLGFGAVRGHRVLLDRLDRRYFREQYDARQILADLVERCRSAQSQRELADALRSHLTQALHADSVRILVSDARQNAFLDSGADLEPLDPGRALLQLAETASGAFDTDLEMYDTPVHDLPAVDRNWILDAGAKLCVPLRATSGKLVGLLMLGEKRSELPYSAEDRRWLESVGAAAALALGSLLAEERRLSGVPEQERAAGVRAAECLQCGTIYPASRARCERCEGSLQITQLPLVIAGKFRLVKRLGDGAMGVVYRGIDVHLSRAVAIKTLPRLQETAAARLRREARVIASVSHPSLAAIYGVESWQGMPMLVLELLAGGTLADRLGHGPMPSAEVLQLGLSLAEALSVVHRAGILHRDVKPSNIGFTADGVPKLLDFGVSRLMRRVAVNEPTDSDERTGERAAVADIQYDSRLTTTADGRVVGTPLYLSPEAVNAERPDPSFDLWSLCIVLYEAMAGAHPLKAPTVSEVLWRITRCDVPDIRVYLPGARAELAAFFASAFASDRSRRPATALEVQGKLQALLAP